MNYSRYYYYVNHKNENSKKWVKFLDSLEFGSEIRKKVSIIYTEILNYDLDIPFTKEKKEIDSLYSLIK